MSNLRRLIREIHRRSLWQVLSIYVVSAWFGYEIIDTITNRLALPAWLPGTAIVLFIIGLPIVLATAFVQEGVRPFAERDMTLLPESALAARAQVRDRPTVADHGLKRYLTWRNLIMGGVCAFALWGAAAAVWLALRAAGGEEPLAPSIPAGVTRVAVLPFSVQGSDEFDYLGEGMVDLLSTKLDISGGLRSADPRAVLGLLAREGGSPLDPERGRDIARRLGAGFYVLGNVVEVGGQLRLDAALYDVDGGLDAVAEGTAEGPAANVFDLVDRVAVQILIARGGEVRSGSVRIAAVTTDSLRALKEYLQGERALQAGRFSPAMEAFQRAVAIDSSFALAWYRLSIAAEWLARTELMREAAERAFQHAARLSERERRFLEATVTARRGLGRDAERIYQTIVGSYPNDVEAWLQLGEVQFHYGLLEGRSISDSREAFERVLFYEPDHVSALNHVVRIAAVEGNRTTLDSLVRRFLRANPEGDRAVEVRALHAFAVGDELAIRDVIGELRQASDPTLLITVWGAGTWSGNLQGGLELARLLTRPGRSPEIRAVGHTLIAHMEMTRGRWARTVAELVAAESNDSIRAREFRAFIAAAPFAPVGESELRTIRAQIAALDPTAIGLSAHRVVHIAAHNGLHEHLLTYLLGLLSARLGDLAEAERLAGELEKLTNPGGVESLSGDLALGLRARVAIRRGRPEVALRLLERARMQRVYPMISSPFISQPLERYLRAALLEEVDRLDDALRWYSSFSDASVYDRVFVAPSHLRRAEIYERRGQYEEAARHYGRLVELWADADPELQPQVQRAQDRLAALSAEASR
jgi:serine/threonine-protein kinase